MTRYNDSGDENFVPEVVAEADLVWRPGLSEQPQNPAPNNQGHSADCLPCSSPLLISSSPEEKKVFSISRSMDSNMDRSTKSSRAVERIRAMKEAFKSQIREASGSDIRSRTWGLSASPQKNTEVDAFPDIEIAMRRSSQELDDLTEDLSTSKDDMIAYLRAKLKETVSSLLHLKSITFSIIRSKDQQLKLISQGNSTFACDDAEPNTSSNQAHRQEDDHMADIFDEVLDKLSDEDRNVRFSHRSEGSRNKGLGEQERQDLSKKFRNNDAEMDSFDSNRPSQSRSSSPEARIRRREGVRNELPAPGGGFRRLADMTSNAFLTSTTNMAKLVPLNGKDAADPSKVKYPLKAITGQFSLLSEASECPRKESFRRRRRSGWNAVAMNLDAVQERTPSASKKSSRDEPSNSLKRLPTFHGKSSSIAIPQNWYGKVWNWPKNVLNRIFCLNANLDDEEKTIGPYVRFVWILSLGFMDFFLVLVLLFWPERDFMCMTSGSTPGVIEEEDIIASIGAILALHLGDVIARMRSRDTVGRRIGLRFFSPKAVGGLGMALFNVWDCCIIVVSGVIAWVNNHFCRLYLADDSNSYAYRIVKRLHIIIHIVRCMVGIQKCVRLGKHFKRRLQRAVSMNKRRFVDPENRFDLDLTYICDRLIVMAIPCVDGALYRNDIREVARFFATRHYGRFLVFNLCEDFETNRNGCYDCMLLYDQVQKLPFRDHNVPPLCVLIAFCKQASAWLNENPANVVAVHCQGGKGRSGTFCSSLILWSNFCTTADDALEAFSQRRTDPRIDSHRLQGVSAPCQIRYVHYVEDIVRGKDYVSAVRLLLTSITLHTMPFYRKKKIRVAFVIECFGAIQYDFCKRHGLAEICRDLDIPPEGEDFKFPVEDVLVAGDVTIRFYMFEEYTAGPLPHAELGPGARTIKYGSVTGKEFCFVTFHTSFHNDSITFSKTEIDGAYDKTNLDFLDTFSLSVSFEHNSSPKRPLNLDLYRPIGETDEKHSSSCYLNDSPSHGNNEIQDVRKQWKSIPYGIVAGPRLLRLYEAVEEIMASACPETICFTRGQMIYDPEEPEFERSLYIIVFGVAEYDFVNKEEQEKWARINRGDSIAGICIGAGQFYGELKFLLGNEGDPSSFCLRASSDVVQVRVLRMSGECGSCSGIVPTSCRRYPVTHFSTIFEVLAKALSAKARDLALHISRMSIKPSNVKRDANVRAREAQLIQKVVQELHLTCTDCDIKTAPATLFSKNGSETAGILLVFTNEIVFFANSRFGHRRKNLRLFLKDIPNVSSFGEKLSIFVTVDKLKEHASYPIERSKTLGNSREKSISPDRLERGRSNSPSRAQSSICSTSSPKRTLFGNSFFGSVGQKKFMNISSLATTASPTTPEEAQVCLHFSLADGETCSEMKSIILDRIFDIQMASINFQKEAYHTSEKLRGSELMFGYLLPDEVVREEDREAVNQIFMQAKSYSYKNGEVILRRGSVERKLFHVLSGFTSCLSPTGQVLVRLGPGEIFGEISFLDSGDAGAGANVVAEGNVECLVVVHETMEMLATLQPLVGVRFWRSLAVATAFRMRQQYHAVETRRMAHLYSS